MSTTTPAGGCWRAWTTSASLSGTWPTSRPSRPVAPPGCRRRSPSSEQGPPPWGRCPGGGLKRRGEAPGVVGRGRPGPAPQHPDAALRRGRVPPAGDPLPADAEAEQRRRDGAALAADDRDARLGARGEPPPPDRRPGLGIGGELLLAQFGEALHRKAESFPQRGDGLLAPGPPGGEDLHRREQRQHLGEPLRLPSPLVVQRPEVVGPVPLRAAARAPVPGEDEGRAGGGGGPLAGG